MKQVPTILRELSYLWSWSQSSDFVVPPWTVRWTRSTKWLITSVLFSRLTRKVFQENFSWKLFSKNGSPLLMLSLKWSSLNFPPPWRLKLTELPIFMKVPLMTLLVLPLESVTRMVHLLFSSLRWSLQMIKVVSTLLVVFSLVLYLLDKKSEF